MGRKSLMITISLALSLCSCGRSKGGGQDSGVSLGEIRSTVGQVSQEFQIPSRLLLAVGFKESGLSALPSSSIYNAEHSLGVSVGESAFGLKLDELGLENEDSSYQLPSQIRAYAKLVRTYIDEKGLSLGINIDSPDELYDWVWQLSLLHRKSNKNRKNVQIIFALELINYLNEGYTWQSSKTGEIVQLAPANPKILTENFSNQIQKNLELDTQKSEIYSVDYMQLTFDQGSGQLNIPNHIRVIHCPFSLSACLEIQSKTHNQEDARLQAHYVIPPDQSILTNPIKILQHRIPVLVTDNLGRVEQIRNAVVIMLVGDSGRYVDGIRVRSNPLWYTSYQLKNLGEIVHGICELMKLDNPTVNLDTCKIPGVSGGVQFMEQGSSENYRWGTIPDFNKNIFWSYIYDPDEQDGSAEFDFGKEERLYNAGESIDFDVNFIRGARKIEIELLERCENGKTIWTTLETRYVRDAASSHIQTRLYQQGPNFNGQHFFRALVYGEDNRLTSWAVVDLFLKDYDQEKYVFAELDACS